MNDNRTWNALTLAFAGLLAALWLPVGCAWIDRDRINREIDRLKPDETETTPDTTPTTTQPPAPVTGWRDGRDMATIAATGNAVSWRTRNVLPAPGAGHNQDGGMEWIIARIEGAGYNRLLIMVMGGSRPPSRIYFQFGDQAPFVNSVFPVPLPGPSQWRVEASGGALRVFLDGKEIWSRAGGYGVSRAIMTGYAKRGFLGEWSAE